MIGKTILAVVMFSGILFAADDPFSGTWVLNHSKSKIPPPVPKSLIARMAVNGSDIEATEEIISDSGQLFAVHVKAKFDGKDYAITGSPAADTVAYERLDRNTIRGVAKKAGNVVAYEKAVITPDGKYMTGTNSGTDESGENIIAVYVLEKK
jgi:hypothetical protein